MVNCIVPGSYSTLVTNCVADIKSSEKGLAIGWIYDSNGQVYAGIWDANTGENRYPNVMNYDIQKQDHEVLTLPKRKLPKPIMNETRFNLGDSYYIFNPALTVDSLVLEDEWMGKPSDYVRLRSGVIHNTVEKVNEWTEYWRRHVTRSGGY